MKLDLKSIRLNDYENDHYDDYIIVKEEDFEVAKEIIEKAVKECVEMIENGDDSFGDIAGYCLTELVKNGVDYYTFNREFNDVNWEIDI